jgi:hypothetical protein
MPPMMIRKRQTERRAPEIQGATPKLDCMALAMLLIWGMLPVPKAQMMVAMAKRTASHFMFNFRSM